MVFMVCGEVDPEHNEKEPPVMCLKLPDGLSADVSSFFIASFACDTVQPHQPCLSPGLSKLMHERLPDFVDYLQKFVRHVLDPIRAMPSSDASGDLATLKRHIGSIRRKMGQASTRIFQISRSHHYLLLEDLLGNGDWWDLHSTLRHPFFWKPDECVEFIGKVCDLQHNQRSGQGWSGWNTLSTYLNTKYKDYIQCCQPKERVDIKDGRGWWRFFGQFAPAWKAVFPKKHWRTDKENDREDSDWKTLLELVRDHQVHQPFIRGEYAKQFVDLVPFLVWALWRYVQENKAAFQRHGVLNARYFPGS